MYPCLKVQRSGFTLVELVVVILILGILAAVATPKLFNMSGTATDNGLRQTLSVIRDAIELYSAEHGRSLPGANGNQSTFKNDLQQYMRGPFPQAPVGPKEGTNGVEMEDEGDPLEGGDAPDEAWIYDYTTGEFILNYNGVTGDGVTRYDRF